MVFDNISALCRSHGISIAKLEKECGLGNATIRRWKDSEPTLSNLLKVANFFGISVSEICENSAKK